MTKETQATEPVTAQPVKVGEKTTRHILEITRLQREMQTLLETIAQTLREVHGVPDAWQLMQMSDGIYLVEGKANPPQPE